MKKFNQWEYKQQVKNKQLIINVITDLASSFLYYDRKADEDLPRYAIEKAIKEGLITKEEIINIFALSLKEGLK